MQRFQSELTLPASVSDGLPQLVSSFADAIKRPAITRPRTATARATPNQWPKSMMRVVVVGVMGVMMMVPMVRRVRQRDVCEKNQCDREANDLAHDSIPNLIDDAFRRIG
jgi:hypothetical protein